mmetsp:Transcript_10859/g.19852  ORF Transcript_10859/g.19852 Transcript_10859/m.19852 type:complete len:256 (-) Transcript_10859:466-1233(-)
MSTMDSAEFDSLRREATKLERHLEDRVSRYQQLAQRLATGGNEDGMMHSQNQSFSLLDAAETGNMQHSNSSFRSKPEEEEAILSADISRTLQSMTDLINQRMQPVAERTGKSQHALLVKRYREILFDSSTDFHKTSAAVARRREARDLFQGADKSKKGDARDPAMEQLLRERNSIEGSRKSANAVLGQAHEIRSDLRSQGNSLRGVSSTMVNIASNIPGVNKLIETIRKKRGQDDKIVSGVIAACVLFTLYYLFG